MISSKLLDKIYISTLSLLLLGMFIHPIVATIDNYSLISLIVNHLTAKYLVAISLLILVFKVDHKDLIYSKLSKPAIVSIILFAMIMVGWLIQYYAFWARDRWYVYVSCLLFFIVLLRLKNIDKIELLSYFAFIKVLVLIGVSIFFIYYIYIKSTPEDLKTVATRPPIYRNLRHFNYELFFAFIFICYLILTQKKYHLLLYIALFLTLFLSNWSGGRGALLGILAFSIALTLMKPKQFIYKILIISISMSIFSASIISWTDKDQMLSRLYSRSITFDEDGALDFNKSSSSRIQIWSNTLHYTTLYV